MLIVEDHAFMRGLLKDFLHAAYPDITIREAAGGEEALAACIAYRPRLVLMDIGLPDASGIDLTGQIKELLPDSTVIIVSQHAQSEFRDRAQAAGASAYVTKDRIYRELLPAVARALGSAA